jgi:hypothetical protein
MKNKKKTKYSIPYLSGCMEDFTDEVMLYEPLGRYRRPPVRSKLSRGSNALPFTGGILNVKRKS